MKPSTFQIPAHAGLALSLLLVLGLATTNATNQPSRQSVAVATAIDAAAAPAYQVQDLGTLPGDYASAAMGINQAGDVVGWSLGPTGTRAFLYTAATGMTALPSPAGRPVTTARSVTDTGFVVGNASTGGTDIGHAVRWQSGTVRDLGTLGTGLFSDARGVNAAGVTVGTSYTAGGGLLGIHAFRYDNTAGLVDLTPGVDDAHAEAVNDAGQVTGWRNSRAFRLTGGTFADFGVPTGFASSFGFAINRSGQVAGHVQSASGNAEKIFRFTDASGLVVLGGVGQFNRANGINAAGDVVGVGQPVAGLRQGFVYTDSQGMQGLNALVDPAAGWFVLGAGGINDAGQIVGWASGPQGQRAVRLTRSGATAAPAAPTALAGAVVTATRVRLNWTDNATTEAGFRVERSVGAQGSFVLLAQVGANTTSYTDKSLKARSVYRYRVRAYNTTGPSAWSNVITIAKR
jgi:probable HAF family extracellular repeat protein